MSNRVFKKVFGEDDLKQPASPESEDEQPVAFQQQKGKGTVMTRNPYELLNELESEQSEAKEEDDENETPSESSRIVDDASQSVKKKRKKKKHNKKKRALLSGSEMDLMEDEAALQHCQAGMRPGETSIPKNADKGVDLDLPSNNSHTEFDELFKIDPKFLNAEFELKKIFGSKVVNYERSKHGQRRIYRQSRLVMPKEQWPSSSGSGISMSYLHCIDGYLYFKYDHNPHYRDIQGEFMKAVDSLNPDSIVNIVRLHPYHIDSHIQLSDMAKVAEDMQVAADLIEGAVHCLETVFHARFVLCNPSCRLEYKYQENRPFFILLFKHLTFVGQRACHRTALELCKRLLCLDPASDPLCVTLMIDFYALKAGEVQWLIDVYNYWEKERNLDQLPNFSYSVALGYHKMSIKADARSSNSELDLSKFETKADELIQYALLMFPSVLLPLLDKLGVQVDARARHHNYFNSYAQSSQSRSLKLLCELYVWRTYHTWREPSVLAWLEKNVHKILDQVDGNEKRVKEYEMKRNRRYLATTPRNVIRHVLLTDYKDLTLILPPELTKEAILNYDPLPPSDSVDIYNIRDFQSSAPTSGRSTGGVLHMLLDSLWNDLNAPQNRQNENLQLRLADRVDAPQHDNAGIALGAGLQQSVTALLDAMRDLLSNANQQPEGDAEAADGDDDGIDRDA